MKVLLINDYGYEAGGAEVIVYTLRDALVKCGHEVRVFASSASNGRSPQMADDLCHGTLAEERTSLQCMNLSAFRELRKVVRFFNPDVAHVNLYLTQLSPFILQALGRVPTIYYAQWYRAICPIGTRLLPAGDKCTHHVGIECLKQGCIPRHYWPRLMAQMAINQVWFRRFNRVTAISRAVATQLEQYGGDAMQNVDVIYPGTKWIAPRTAEHLALNPIIICAGRLVSEKGIDVLIRAFWLIHASHSHCELWIVGDGPSCADLIALVERLGLKNYVMFMGQKSQIETLALIRQSWCLCVPSLWEEPFGMIAAEAQMQGIPVIASQSGGLAEIIDDDNTGFLVQPGNVDALAKCMLKLITNRSLVIKFGRQAHARASRLFDADDFAKRLELVYDKVITGVGFS
jgi:glycosyltransferase involved in cell wall biosynthesis